MNRKKKDIIILAILLPVLFFFLFSGWHKKGRHAVLLETEEITKTESDETPVSNDSSGGKLDEIIKEQIVLECSYLEKGLPRNPFVQLMDGTKIKSKSITVILSGIFCSEDSNNLPHALINGKILSKGDVLAGLTIEEIGTNQVILRQGDSKYKIKVGTPLKINIP